MWGNSRDIFVGEKKLVLQTVHTDSIYFVEHTHTHTHQKCGVLEVCQLVNTGYLCVVAG